MAMQLKRAILITYPDGRAISEAVALADAAGYKVEKIVTQKHITRSRFGIGRGKAVPPTPRRTASAIAGWWHARSSSSRASPLPARTGPPPSNSRMRRSRT